MNREPKVFVVQNQHRWDDARKAFVPKFNLEPAAIFGKLEFLLSPTAAPFRFSASVRDELVEKLRDYREGDWLLLVGNPALILAVGSIAASYNGGDVAVLQWDGREERYISIHLRGLAPGFTSS